MKTLKFALILLAATIFFNTAAFAEYLPSEATQAERVNSLDLVASFLQSDNYVASRLEFRKLSADPVRDLVSITTANGIQANVRARAIQSLALYGHDVRVREVLENLITKNRATHALYPTIILAYAEAFGEQGVATLEGLASHRNTDVRMATVVALGRFGGQAGFDLLSVLAQTEGDHAVHQRITSYVR
ncbi:MAG: hypothetical protein H0U74_11790 [Bradymonadaceae bacterium]|nr:hypothetical protein [Lujinxingiaceae bacterium]